MPLPSVAVRSGAAALPPVRIADAMSPAGSTSLPMRVRGVAGIWMRPKPTSYRITDKKVVCNRLSNSLAVTRLGSVFAQEVLVAHLVGERLCNRIDDDGLERHARHLLHQHRIVRGGGGGAAPGEGRVSAQDRKSVV